MKQPSESDLDRMALNMMWVERTLKILHSFRFKNTKQEVEQHINHLEKRFKKFSISDPNVGKNREKLMKSLR